MAANRGCNTAKIAPQTYGVHRGGMAQGATSAIHKKHGGCRQYLYVAKPAMLRWCRGKPKQHCTGKRDLLEE